MSEEYIDTTAEEFIEKVEGKTIEDVELLDGSKDLSAGKCQFVFQLEDGYSFVG